MPTICPTITVSNIDDYKKQLDINYSLTKRIQVDLMDGKFAPSLSPTPDDIWWPEDVLADVHLMYEKPMDYSERLVELKSNIVIVHAEIDLDLNEFADYFHKNNIKAGVCLLAPTEVKSVEYALKNIDHVIIFSGNLGYQGGSKVDFNLLKKIDEIHDINPKIEIGWDGGVNDETAKRLADGGVDVLNVGGFIQKAENPEAAYQKLVALVG